MLQYECSLSEDASSNQADDTNFLFGGKCLLRRPYSNSSACKICEKIARKVNIINFR